MWCAKCQAEVAAMASPDNERLYCTSCNTELNRAAAATLPEPETPRSLRDPRELLARWAREDALKPLDFSPPPAPDADRDVFAPRKTALRFDASHPVQSPAAALVERAAAQPRANPPPAPREPAPAPAEDHVVHPAHAMHPPHFHAAPVTLADKSTRWVTLVGQLFAYIGVGGLTVGTVLVLMGYFGGPGSYATTGWLVATAGQMLLFLGVITLVSGGMEQTTQEVARRIDTLGERLVRIEEATTHGQSGGPASRSEVSR